MRREFVGPRDNFPLSEHDFREACELCELMVALRGGRGEYLAAAGLDERIYLPSHMWEAPWVVSNFDKIARRDYHTINHLRCLTYNFTGYSLLAMAPCEKLPEVLAVPANADEIIRTKGTNAGEAAVEFVRSVAGMPRERIVDTPRMFGESGWDVDGTIVNWDTWSNQQRINGLHCSGVLDLLERRVKRRGHARVVEIGAGYGNLAYSLKRMLGAIDYTVVDLPESMIYSSIYLNTVLPEERCRVACAGEPLGPSAAGVTFVANYMLEEFLPQIGDADVVLNMMSLSEMSPAQVGYYGDCAGRLIGNDGVFYEQNYMLPEMHTNIVAILQRQFAYGAELDGTVGPHRGRGVARMWSNRYRGGLWNRGGVTPIACPRPTFSTVEVPRAESWHRLSSTESSERGRSRAPV